MSPLHEPLTLHPLGIGIAAGFAVTISSLLWWMLHPPAAVQAAVAKALRGVSAVRRILVPVRGSAYNERAVELACRLGADQKAEIVACHVVVVPLSLPLSTTLEPEQKHAEECLARAQEIAEHHGLPVRTVVQRERDVARGVLRVAQDQDVDMVVLGINPKNLAAGESVGKATEQLLRKSHIEVIVDMHPEVDQ
jgi:nucleotide-binding universal stress UspA family protein